MRLLGNFKTKHGGANVVAALFFVRPGKIFVRYTTMTALFDQAILSFNNDKLKVVNRRASSPSCPAKRELIDFANEKLQDENIKTKYNDMASKYVSQIVRPISKCTYSTYPPSAQSLGITSKPDAIVWYTCREQFANQFSENVKNIYFCVMNSTSGVKDYKGARLRLRRVARFIRRLENLLHIPEKSCSVFYETSAYNVIEVLPATFWSKLPIRRSLFTILLRAGLLYDFNTDNYKDALNGYSYSSNTIKAVLRFLDGYTKFVGHEMHSGWVATFMASANKDVNKVLVKP